MDFNSAANDISTLDVLRSIEDKLYERGLLVMITGDSEGEVTINFTTITLSEEEIPALLISVVAAESDVTDKADWEGLSDYVNDEYLGLRPLLRRDVLAALDESCGQYVTFNGRFVY
jgi:hypothetical protein